MKRMLLIGAAAMMWLSTPAKTAIVKADILNVRERPTTESRRLDRLPMYTIIDAGEETDEWCPMTWERLDPETNSYVADEGFVKAEFIDILPEEGIPADMTNCHLLLDSLYDDFGGTLIISPGPDGDVSVWYRIVNRELQRAGGTGTVEVGEFTCRKDDNRYYPESQSSEPETFSYDPATGRAVFAGYIWTKGN